MKLPLAVLNAQRDGHDASDGQRRASACDQALVKGNQDPQSASTCICALLDGAAHAEETPGVCS